MEKRKEREKEGRRKFLCILPVMYLSIAINLIYETKV